MLPFLGLVWTHTSKSSGIVPCIKPKGKLSYTLLFGLVAISHFNLRLLIIILIETIESPIGTFGRGGGGGGEIFGGLF